MSGPPTDADLPAGDIILFDGVCNLCNASVRFILKRDRDARYRFAALQSAIGQSLLSRTGLPADYRESFLLLERSGGNLQCRTRSAAALRVAGRLRFPWPMLGVLWIVPAPLRDALYDWVGRNRYRWFGRRDTCALPEPAWSGRFLEGADSVSGREPGQD